jgi:simple sugar transport system substrate-binding protein
MRGTRAPIAGAWLLLGLCTFAIQARGAERDAPKRLRLVFITTCAEAKFFEPVVKGMEDAARMMGVECKFTGTPGVDFKAQAEMVRQAVKDGYDGIALNLVHTEAFDEVVQEAIEQGVPVVGFNTDDHATPNARLSGVNQRLYAAGRALARYVSPHIRPGSHVLLTMHDRGVSSLEDRLRGLQNVLKEKKVKWTVAVTGNDSAKGAEIVADLLKKNSDIRVVLGTGQADTEAAGRAIEKHFANRGYWSAGFDLSPETLRLIQKGVIRGTVDQQPYVQGFYPVIQLTLYLRYGLKPSDMDAGAAIIDRSNVAQAIELTKKKYR